MDFTKEQIKQELEKRKSGGFSKDQIQKELLRRKSSQEQTYLDQAIQASPQRQAEFERVQRQFNQGDITAPEYVLQNLGEAAGNIGDVVGRGIGDVAGFGFNLLPQSAQQKLSQGAGAVGQFIEPTVSSLSKSYGMAKEQFPRAAENVEAAANIALLSGLGPAKTIAKGLTGDVVRETTQTAGRVASRAFPQIDESLKPLAKRALDFNIPLRFDQVKPSQLSATTQKVSQAIPLSGTAKFENIQRNAWNTALAKTMGLKDLQPRSIKEFKAKNSTMFDDVLQKRNIEVSTDDYGALANYRNVMDEMHGLTSRDLDIVNKQIDDVLSSISLGENKGQVFSSLRSNLLSKAERAGEASPAYYDLVDILDDISQKSMSLEDIEKLSKARQEYKYYKTVQKTLAGEPLGDVNPTKLMSKVASSRYIDPTALDVGDDSLVDLARIGKEFLSKQGGSDTFEKAALFGGIGAGGYGVGAGSLLPTLGIAGGVMGANRALQAGVLRNQGLVNELVQRSPLLQKPSLESAANLSKMSPSEYARFLALYNASQEEEK